VSDIKVKMSTGNSGKSEKLYLHFVHVLLLCLHLPMGFDSVIPNLQYAEPFLPTAHTCLSAPQLILASA
jgi:hypothetical protein